MTAGNAPIPPGRPRPRYGKKGVKRLTAGGRGEAILPFSRPLRDVPIRWTTKAPPEEKKPRFTKETGYHGRRIVLHVFRCRCGCRFWDEQKDGPLAHYCRLCVLRMFGRKAPRFVLPLTEQELSAMATFFEQQGVKVIRATPSA